MIDIVFTLLIFFAVSTSFVVAQKGMKLDLPAAASVSDAPPKSLTLSIDSNRQYFLDKKSISQEEISTQVAELMKENPKLEVVVQADRGTPYYVILAALDEIRIGGCFDLVLEAEKKSSDHGAR